MQKLSMVSQHWTWRYLELCRYVTAVAIQEAKYHQAAACLYPTILKDCPDWKDRLKVL